MRGVLALVLLLSGCAAYPEPETAPETAPRAAVAPICGADDQCGERQLCARRACVDITADLAECRVPARVPFTLGSAQVSEAAGKALQRSARCVRAGSPLLVILEPAPNEPGTEDERAILAGRRALATAGYLGTLGVTPAALARVTWGELSPVCVPDDAMCWARARRVSLSRNLR